MKSQDTQGQQLTPAQEASLDRQLESDRKMDAAVKSIAAMQYDCARIIGQIQTFETFNQFSATGKLVLMRQVKESRAYKGLQIPQPDGSFLVINTFDDFCSLMGTSKSKVEEDIQNLNMFGEAFMESASAMGLGYRDLRKLRALPEDDRAIVVEGEKVGSDPEALKDLIEELAAKRAEDRKKMEGLTADLEAREKVLGEKNKSLDKAKEELIRLKNIPPDEEVKIQWEKEDEALKELHKAGLILNGYFASYLSIAQGILNREELSRHAKETVMDITSGFCVRIDEQLRDAGIDIDFRVIAYPMSVPQRGDDLVQPIGE